jgi:GNAT superfamily N-acetyltransferase
MPLTIDLLGESDLPAALRLSTHAGWNQIEADWWRLLALWPQTCFAGRENGQLVATTTLAAHGAHVGWVGMVLVDEAHRGQGIAGRMVEHLLAVAQERGIKTLGLDATEAGREIYLSHGFHDVDDIDRWIRHAAVHTATPVTGERSIQSTESSTWKSALAMDLAAIRLDRSRLLTALAGEPGVRWRTLGEGADVKALAMLRPGRVAMHLGPVIADCEESAGAVLDLLLTETAVARDRDLIIDVSTTCLTRWLADHGFRQSRPLLRMQAGIRGPDILGPKVFAACGFELG